MSRAPVFVDLAIDPAPKRPSSDGIDFTLIGSATWAERDARVGFTVRHIDRRRLVVTSLSIDAHLEDPIGSAFLHAFPVGQLLAAVREWIVNGGDPNGATTKAFLERGWDPAELSAHDDWARDRAEFIGLLRSSADGAPRGRKRKRDDAYLKDLAEQYVAVAQTNRRNPRVELAAKRGQEPSSLASDIDLARDELWLAKPQSKGQRTEQNPGPRLIAAWEQDGYPEWHPNHQQPDE